MQAYFVTMTVESLVIAFCTSSSLPISKELHRPCSSFLLEPAMNTSIVVQAANNNSSIAGNGYLERTSVAFDDKRTVEQQLNAPFEQFSLKPGQSVRKRITGGKPPIVSRSSTASTIDLSSSFDFLTEKLTPKKKVNFAINLNGKVHKETFRYQQHRTKQEVADCWFTQAEFRGFRQDCKQEAISQQKTEYRKHFAAVYDACKKGSFKAVTKQRAYISAASCRGLEAVVYSALQADRKNLLITVLKTQHAIPQSFSQQKREDTIASASRFLSKQSRQLARVLGSGDAAVVVANERLAASSNSKAASAAEETSS